MSKNRNEVPANLKWDLTGIFASAEEFDALYKEVENSLDFSAYEGKLSDETALYNLMVTLDGVDTKIEKLAVYAMMYRDLDTRNSDAVALSSRVDALFVKYSSSTAFITPELTALPEEVLKGYIERKV